VLSSFSQTTKNHHVCDGFLIDSVWVARHCRSWLDERVVDSTSQGVWGLSKGLLTHADHVGIE
jgi:hypothetical protein